MPAPQSGPRQTGEDQITVLLADREQYGRRPSRAATSRDTPASTEPAKPAALVHTAVKPAARAAVLVRPPAYSRARTVVQFALAQVGKPYQWAADGPSSYDCSGLAMAAYARVGIRLPHQTGGIITMGRPVSRSQLQPGDLVFPSSGHVGIYIGGGKMVHAPHTGDYVRVAYLYAFTAARRLL